MISESFFSQDCSEPTDFYSSDIQMDDVNTPRATKNLDIQLFKIAKSIKLHQESIPEPGSPLAPLEI